MSVEDWAVAGRTADRTNAAPDARLNVPLEEAWRYGAEAGFGLVSPLIVDSVIFVGNLKGDVHAIHLRRGKRLGVKKLGSSLTGTPAFADNVLYVPNAWGRIVLQAHDVVQGRTLWSLRGVPIENALAVRDDLLFAATIESGVAALDRRTGEIVWAHEGDPVRTYYASPVVSGETVYVVDDRGNVRTFDAETGAFGWDRALRVNVSRTPAVHDGRLYIPTETGTLVALDARSGDSLWTYASADTLVKLTSPSVSNERVVVAGTDGVVRSLDSRDGTLAWTAALDGTVTAPPLLLGETVFVGSHDKRVLALDARDGKEIWSQELRGRVRSSLAYREGYLVVLAEPRFVYAFKPAELPVEGVDAP